MGMFDYITCDYPLPELPDFVKEGHQFQTKDMNCELANYQISKGGKLTLREMYAHKNSKCDHTGTIEFYTSNICACGPGIYTRNGEDAESVTYLATFVDGLLIEVERTSYERRPGMISDWHVNPSPTPTVEDIKLGQERDNADLTGQRVYVLWGGQEVGYWAKVLHSGKKEHCLEKEDDGTLELMARIQRDNIFFDSEEEAFARRQSKADDWQTRKDRYDNYAAEWYAKRGESRPAV